MLTALLDGALFAERTGTASSRVLALHGWGRSRADLLPVVQGLDALVPDLPGFGASPPPPEPWGTEQYAEQLAQVLGGRSWLLVGHSFGGRVAVQLAARHPSLVAGVVLTGVPLLRTGGSGRAPLAFRVAKRLHAAGLVSDARMEQQRQRHGSADYRAATGVMRGTLVRTVSEDYRDLLPGISAPVRMVWGAKDTAAPLAMAREAQALLPAAELVVSETSGHLLDEPLLALLRDAVGQL